MWASEIFKQGSGMSRLAFQDVFSGCREGWSLEPEARGKPLQEPQREVFLPASGTAW